MTMALALTIAAALATSFTACTNEDNTVNNPEQPTLTSNAQITVNAVIADNASTRSEVTTDDYLQAVTFTTGDQLYVYGEIDASTSVAGYLTMVGSPTNSNKSAKFSGTVKAYDISGATPVETKIPLGGDPLAVCLYKNVKATLVHKDMNTKAISITLGHKVELYTDYMSAANVETLIQTGLPVQGGYDSDTKSITLSSESPVIDCTLTGLTAATTYEVGFFYETPTVWIQSFRYSFPADESGKIHIAFVSWRSGERSWKFSIGFPSDYYDIELGTMDLSAKIYKVASKWDGKAFVNP